jgi:hypothetical protein
MNRYKILLHPSTEPYDRNPPSTIDQLIATIYKSVIESISQNLFNVERDVQYTRESVLRALGVPMEILNEPISNSPIYLPRSV